jgi:hypothetical protein
VYISGDGSPFIFASVLAVPYPLAQPEMLCKIAGFEAATPLRVSSNFSQTRGTAKKKVGLAQLRVSTKDP